MPIYEYRCDRCQHIFEEIQSYSDPAPDACPACAEPDVHRMISNTTFQLKGGGWYATDNPPSSSVSSSSAQPGASSSVSASSDTAPSPAPAVSSAPATSTNN